MKKSQKGFTLVELIVVIAIIGVLAAILVPSMMGYVKKSKLKSANSNAKLVFTTANSALADCIVEGKTPSTAAFSTTSVKSWSNSAASSADDILKNSVYDALKDNGDGAGSVYFALDATTKSSVTFAQWHDSATAGNETVLIGQYPDPEDNPDAKHKFGSKFA